MLSRETGAGVSLLARPNPFRTEFHWDLGPERPQVILADTPSGAVTIPSAPTLLVGVAGSGRRATLDAIVAHASAELWVTGRCSLRPGRPLRMLIAAAIDEVANAIAPHVDDAVGVSRLRMAIDDLRVPSLADPTEAYVDGLLMVTEIANSVRWGVLLCVDDLHAASTEEASSLIRAVNEATARSHGFRAVVTATHRPMTSREIDDFASWSVVPLLLDFETLRSALVARAVECGGEIDDSAVAAIVDISGGIPQVALAHAAAAWDSCAGSGIDAERVIATQLRADSERFSALRMEWSSMLTLGQRRYLRAVAELGAIVAIDDVADVLQRDATMELTMATIETVTDALVRNGLLIVVDGYLSLGVPGLDRVL